MYRYEPTGILGLHVNREHYRFVASVQDNRSKKMEERINELICKIYYLIDAERVEKLTKQVEEDAKLQRKQKAFELEISRRSGSARIKHIGEQAVAWETTQRLRAFVEAVKREIQSRPAEAGEDTEAWIHWAESYIDAIDPLSHRRSLPVYSLSDAQREELRQACASDWSDHIEEFVPGLRSGPPKPR